MRMILMFGVCNTILVSLHGGFLFKVLFLAERACLVEALDLGALPGACLDAEIFGKMTL